MSGEMAGGQGSIAVHGKVCVARLAVLGREGG